MTKKIRTLIFLFVLTVSISCHGPTNKPLHYLNKFTFKDEDGHENYFYGFKNIDSARHWATIEKKRILVIFSCYACMDEGGKEWKTLSNFGDNNKIQNNFILCWVPIDDKTLADNPALTFIVNEKEVELKTFGLRNWYWQTNLTKTSSQPTMCFIDTVGAKYGDNLNYSKDQKEIETFINVGLDRGTKGQIIFYPPIPKINFVETEGTL